MSKHVKTYTDDDYALAIGVELSVYLNRPWRPKTPTLIDGIRKLAAEAGSGIEYFSLVMSGRTPNSKYADAMLGEHRRAMRRQPGARPPITASEFVYSAIDIIKFDGTIVRTIVPERTQ